MSLTRAILNNTAIQVTGKLLGTIFGIVTVGILTRHLGQAGYGQFTTATSFLQFFGILADFGLTLTLLRLIARPEANESKLIANVFSLRLLTATLFFGGAAAVGFLFPYPPAVKLAIAIGSASFFLMSLTSVLSGVFQKHLVTAYAAIAEVAGRATLLLGVWLVSYLGYGLLATILMLIAGNFVQFGLTWLYVRRVAPLRLEFDWPVIRHIITESWPIGISIAFNLVYLKGDIVVLSLFRPDTEIGLYGAAYKVLDVVTVIPMVFMGLALPVLANAWQAGDRGLFKRRLARAFDFMSMLALPLMFGAWAVGHDLMTLIAGAEFRESGTILGILIVGAGLVFWGSLFGHAVVALGLQRKLIWAYAVDAVISFVLYFWLIPRFGSLAAAWVTVFSEGFIAVSVTVAVLLKSGARPSLAVFWRCLLAAGLMMVALQQLPAVPVLVRILIGALVYLAVLLLIGGLKKEMLQLFFGRQLARLSRREGSGTDSR